MCSGTRAEGQLITDNLINCLEPWKQRDFFTCVDLPDAYSNEGSSTATAGNASVCWLEMAELPRFHTF